ncbi:Tn3 family transposase [Tengunoibacter tsumagoiensis]|uniref:Transposase n=1 Tax=Tengunoibacter tsumagoiensis TaxID=2014871 RepID=A0A402A1K3_9CHLR|nr:Tn3 family transposase [Tengunoibacter tsumagoiensis]GCE12936.1 transposase [Tengunoibacter tsumagoiensis]
MPVEYLTEVQEQRYGRYVGEPSPEQLARYFHLDDEDRKLIRERRGDHNRLGFGVQIGTVRFLGTFLSDPINIPIGVIRYVAEQLTIADPGCITHYAERVQTHQDHAQEIRKRYDYTEWSSPLGGFALTRFLYARAWIGTERPSVLFDLATAWLLDKKVLLPGVTTLTRLISAVRERVAERLWQRLSQSITPEQQTDLDGLLARAGTSRITNLERLRRAPTRASAPVLVAALARLSEVRHLGTNTLDLANVPASRIKALAHYAVTTKAQNIANLTPDRRTATLVSLVHTLTMTAQDDALDVLDMLMRDLLARSVRTGRKERLRTLRDLDQAALYLAEQTEKVITPDWSDEQVRTFLNEKQVKIAEAVATIYDIARPPDDNYHQEVVERYPTVRRFLPSLLRTISWSSNEAGKPVLDAMNFLRDLEGRKHPDLSAAPMEVVPVSWKRYVAPVGQSVDRRYYTLCVMARLQEAMRRHDVFVIQSTRWGDPRAKLLTGAAWESARPTLCQSLGRKAEPKLEREELSRRLDEAYRRVAGCFPTNPAARIEKVKNKAGQEQDTLVLTGLEKVEEPDSLHLLRHRIARRLPTVDLPELLLEIQARTGFASEFSHISEGGSRVDDLPTSICAVLIAQACNIGLTPLVRKGIPALERDRLSYVQQNYIRPETLSRANARLVDYQAQIPLAQAWGGGEVASADGLRFLVPLRTLNAGPNPKYFGTGRGITLINYTSDQFSGFKNIVVTGTLRDSLAVLEGLLNQETGLRPKELMTDTASYADIIFGLFHLLGYQFSPRLADIGSTRFWRIDKAAHYGVLNDLARHTIDTDLIEDNWEDLLRVAGSLKMGTVNVTDLLRALQGGGRPSTLGRAIGELGRIAKTLFLLSYISDEAYRRRILIQLNKGESRHSLARATFFGQKGEVRQRYREGQEEQLGALGLVVNAIVLWNTLYMNRAVEDMRERGMAVLSEDVERLSPLGYDHVNLLGRYTFSLSEEVRQGAFHPLRELEETVQEERQPEQKESEETSQDEATA